MSLWQRDGNQSASPGCLCWVCGGPLFFCLGYERISKVTTKSGPHFGILSSLLSPSALLRPPSLVSPHVLQFFIGQWASLIFKNPLLCSAGAHLARHTGVSPAPQPWFRCLFPIQLLAVLSVATWALTPNCFVSFCVARDQSSVSPSPPPPYSPERPGYQGSDRDGPSVPCLHSSGLAHTTLYLVCTSASSLPGLRFPWAGVRILEDACNLPATDSRTDSGHLQHTATLGDAPWDAVESTARHTMLCSAGSQQCSGPCSSPPQWSPLCRFWGPSSKDPEYGGLDSRWWEGDLGGTPADLHNLAGYDALIMRSQAPIPGLTWADLFVSEVKTERTAFHLGFPVTGTERAGRT
ncbi:hypothetical protein CDEST_06253 [Colletotrichum destructivum]|uniref:Uncharacterized protein n=1 Tax=Colletotrichum destructivum TaxID=34406 RepID=A0AAX4IDA3_9PEZI|nr:hypothetical protein CDEST_06253 [Colletotrichum destructivum]